MYLTYDVYGRLKTKTTGQMKQTYVYDNASGNLLSRDYRPSGSPNGLTESFSYDNLNRLTGSQVTGAGLMTVTYSPDGNINTKTDAGSYTYDPSKQNAVTSITGSNGTISLADQVITYNGNNLATRIEEDNSSYAIYYNPLKQRIKTVCTPTGGPAMTRYYSGSYEKTITGSTVTETHYVSSPTGLVAILVKQGSAVQTYYVETDHLGSVTGIINTDKTYASKSSYDAWGRRRNPADWSYNNIPTPVITDRGFTGHEHLDRFGLINMNGRMYDPVVGRFLGVDPVVQAPDYSQSYNGYSYCWNNPLKYTDPSGYQLDGLTIYDLVNNLWNSGGGYWSSLNPDYYLSYYHDYDPYENSLLEYSAFQFLAKIPGNGAGGSDGEGLVEYDKKRGEYGYYIKEKPDIPPGICLRFIPIYPAGGGIRPDGDGYLTLGEANYWYNNGNGQPLSADLSKINLRSVSIDDFKKVGDSKYFNLLFYSNSRNDGLVYGSIKLTYMGPTWNGNGGIVSAEYDIYDFDLRDWTSVSNAGRNIETMIGSQVAGPGFTYRINFYNYGLINGPRPPVIY